VTCLVIGCDRGRAPDAAVCRGHLNDLWANRLELVVGGYRLIRQPDYVPEWKRRAALEAEGKGYVAVKEIAA